MVEGEGVRMERSLTGMERSLPTEDPTELEEARGARADPCLAIMRGPLSTDVRLNSAKPCTWYRR